MRRAALIHVVLVGLCWPRVGHAQEDDPTWTLDRCVSEAVGRGAQVAEAEAQVQLYAARLKQVESVYYPKLSGLAFITATNTVKGNALTEDVERDYERWGPYTHLEALLAQPIYTFGRAAAGERAAQARLRVEQSRLEGARKVVALEVKRLYFNHLMAKSLMPTIDTVESVVADAYTKAKALYEARSGQVTKADIMKLEYAGLEVKKARLLAQNGAELALAALQHTMGRGLNDTLVLAKKRLPKPGKAEPMAFEALLIEAKTNRSEWAQLEHGKAAAEELETAERLADAPVLFVAGQIQFDWAPTRQDTQNPYHYDSYNDFAGGVALGLTFDLDPAKSVARADEARALQSRVSALRRFAETGIPLQVKKAFGELKRARKTTELSRAGVKATRKWMTFSALAYQSGTGEARDVLEGVGAYVAAKRSYYEALRDYHVARAELAYAVGR